MATEVINNYLSRNGRPLSVNIPPRGLRKILAANKKAIDAQIENDTSTTRFHVVYLNEVEIHEILTPGGFTHFKNNSSDITKIEMRHLKSVYRPAWQAIADAGYQPCIGNLMNNLVSRGYCLSIR